MFSAFRTTTLFYKNKQIKNKLFNSQSKSNNLEFMFFFQFNQSINTFKFLPKLSNAFILIIVTAKNALLVCYDLFKEYFLQHPVNATHFKRQRRCVKQV